MEQVPATRAELLAKRKQISLAHQSRELLQEKRTALLKEFMRTADQVVRGGDELERSVGESVVALAMAQAIDGPEAVQSAAHSRPATGCLSKRPTWPFSDSPQQPQSLS